MYKNNLEYNNGYRHLITKCIMHEECEVMSIACYSIVSRRSYLFIIYIISFFNNLNIYNIFTISILYNTILY